MAPHFFAVTASDLERLYDLHAAGLFHYLRGFAGSEGDARDLLKGLFVKLAGEAPPADLRSERAWLHRMAHNLAIDHLRRMRHRRVDSSTRGEAMFGETLDPDAAAIASRMEEALGELPVEQRSVFQLKLWEGLTFEEIAEAQGIPLNTAASRYRYALEKMRAQLRPLYDELN